MTKCSLKTCIVLSSFDKEGSLCCYHKKRKCSCMETGINRVSQYPYSSKGGGLLQL